MRLIVMSALYQAVHAACGCVSGTTQLFSTLGVPSQFIYVDKIIFWKLAEIYSNGGGWLHVSIKAIIIEKLLF
jgi:hypothetical protein